MARTRRKPSRSRRFGNTEDVSFAMQEARNAYADTSGSGGTRNLNWRGTELSVEGFCQVAKKAIPNGYNEFEAERVCRVLRTTPNVRVTLAREASPAIYVTGSARDLTKLKRQAKAMVADEVWIEKPKLRLWWD